MAIRYEKFTGPHLTFIVMCCQNRPPVGIGIPRSNDRFIEYSGFEFTGQKYWIGDSAYLPSDTHTFSVKSSKTTSTTPSRTPFPSDEVKYPELYRKSDYVKGSNTDVPKPFQIGSSSLLSNMHLILHLFRSNQKDICKQKI